MSIYHLYKTARYVWTGEILGLAEYSQERDAYRIWKIGNYEIKNDFWLPRKSMRQFIL